MPKEGLTVHEWISRLRKYAQKEFQFTRGQNPPKNSKWYQKKVLIDKCPKHCSLSGKDLFGKPVQCICGFHAAETITKVCIANSSYIYICIIKMS